MKANLVLCLFVATLAAGCGGGGGGSDDDSSGGGSSGGGSGGGGGTSGPPSGTDYSELNDTSGGTVTLEGATLANGSAVSGASGTINLGAQTFTAGGTTANLSSTSGLSIGGSYDFATDVMLDSDTIGVVGVAIESGDVRDTGTIVYSGGFGGQLVQGTGTEDLNNWDATLTVNFGSGDVDATFEGDGSTLIDEIEVNNASVSGTGFSGGTLRTLNNGSAVNVTGTGVDFEGGFFGYNDALDSPAEAGGALASSDDDTSLYGLFIVDSD